MKRARTPSPEDSSALTLAETACASALSAGNEGQAAEEDMPSTSAVDEGAKKVWYVCLHDKVCPVFSFPNKL